MIMTTNYLRKIIQVFSLRKSENGKEAELIAIDDQRLYYHSNNQNDNDKIEN